MKNLLSICLILIMAFGNVWGHLVINEIHADPDSDYGDANGDGTVDSSDDEFIELVNASINDLNISNWTIYENVRTIPRFQFPDSVILEPYQVIVVFGGGSADGNFGNAIVLISGKSLSLNNDGETITVKNKTDIIQTSVTYTDIADNDQSITRSPDITGDFKKHLEVSNLRYSPGKSIQGDISLPVTLSDFTATFQQDGVLLRWTTESEMNNMGFNLYKGESEKGEFQKINASLIPGAGNSSTQNNYSFTDTEIIPGYTYYYQLEDVTYSNRTKKHDKISITIPDNKNIALENYKLFPPSPNPCNPSTTIKIYIADNSTVNLGIYDLRGKLVRTLTNEKLQPGYHSYQWFGNDTDGQLVSNGIYLCRITTKAGFNQTNKLILLK